MLTVLMLVGCSPDLAIEEGEQFPEFALLDENPNSETYASLISPRDYLGQRSAWYFGHET